MVISHPTLAGAIVTIRPGNDEDAPRLHAILSEESVAAWWGEPSSVEEIIVSMGGADDEVLLIVERDGVVVGGIQYSEENEPGYRHAGIDIFLGAVAQGSGAGTEAVRLVATFLIEERCHHRITIDPATTNKRAIRCYEKVGFRSVGIMREYERGRDGTWHDGLMMDLLAAELVR